jgi:glycosyltransferase involved in cell wall biosynthesis
LRFGENPLKAEGKSVEPPAEITVGVLNYIPEQVGYFRHQFESLKLCLASILCHADQPFDLLVVDNGSCSEVRAYLQDELASGRIDCLILNKRNIGKANAVLQILRSAPGDYVFYTDGDVYHKPGWMQAHLDVLRTFPRVGLVGGVPLRSLAKHCTTGTLRWVEENRERLQCEKGDLIPEEWMREFLKSVGVSDRDLEKSLEQWGHFEDCRITLHEVAAYVGASHMQYLISSEAIEHLSHQRFSLALNKKDDHVLDRKVEEAGLLRLSTERPYVYHIGNAISEDWLVEEYRRLVQEPLTPLTKSPPTRHRHWFWGRWSVRCILRWVYECAFDIYRQNAYH